LVIKKCKRCKKESKIHAKLMCMSCYIGVTNNRVGINPRKKNIKKGFTKSKNLKWGGSFL
jgi:hypothetical protein